MERTGLPSGTVYPTLGRLEKREYVRARWKNERVARSEGRPRRRYYRLTGPGEAALNASVREYGQLLGGAPASTGGKPSPAVVVRESGAW